MSSVIVLDSSDSEDEIPKVKRQFVVKKPKLLLKGKNGNAVAVAATAAAVAASATNDITNTIPSTANFVAAGKRTIAAKIIPLTTVNTTTFTPMETKMSVQKQSNVDASPKASIKPINIPSGITVTRHNPMQVKTILTTPQKSAIPTHLQLTPPILNSVRKETPIMKTVNLPQIPARITQITRPAKPLGPGNVLQQQAAATPTSAPAMAVLSNFQLHMPTTTYITTSSTTPTTTAVTTIAPTQFVVPVKLSANIFCNNINNNNNNNNTSGLKLTTKRPSGLTKPATVVRKTTTITAATIATVPITTTTTTAAAATTAAIPKLLKLQTETRKRKTPTPPMTSVVITPMPIKRSTISPNAMRVNAIGTPPPPPQPAAQAPAPVTILTHTPLPNRTSTITRPPETLPIMSTVHAITAASATPPLRLLASPPHNNNNKSEVVNEPLVFPVQLPLDTTVTTQMPIKPRTGVQQVSTAIVRPVQAAAATRPPQITSAQLTQTQRKSQVLATPRAAAPATAISPALQRYPIQYAVPAATQQMKPKPATPQSAMAAAAAATTPQKNNAVAKNNLATVTPVDALPIATAIPTHTSPKLPTMATQTPSRPKSAGGGTNIAPPPPPSSTNTVTSAAKRIKPTTLISKHDAAWQQRSSTEVSTTLGVAQITPKAKAKPAVIKASSSKSINSAEPEVMIVETTATTTPPGAPISTATANAKKSAARLNGGVSPQVSTSIIATTTTTSSSSSKAKGDDIRNVTVKTPPCETKSNTQPLEPPEPPPSLEPNYQELLQVCRSADSEADMELLIKIRLMKYYNSVHPNFVRSRGFLKTVRTAIDAIRAEPDMVYVHLKLVIDELKVRRKTKDIADDIAVQEPAAASASADAGKSNKQPSTSSEAAIDLSPQGCNAAVTPAEEHSEMHDTGNARTNEQIHRLNHALHIVRKRIETLETAEVDLSDDDSSYLQLERFKKRACQIYEKICDLTGENKNALRSLRKPIQFKDTPYTQFNKTLQVFINRTQEFPDYFDVLRMLEHCNKQYDFGLATFEMKRIAHDAFTKVGKLLQTRRKTDLYETVTHFTANAKDPATEDVELALKLNENKKNQKKISDVLEKYAREQELTADELREARLKEQQQAAALENGNDTDCSEDAVASIVTMSATPPTDSNKIKAISSKNIYARTGSRSRIDEDNDDEEDEYDDDDDDDEEEEDDDIGVDTENNPIELDDTLTNGYSSDAESELMEARTSCKIKSSALLKRRRTSATPPEPNNEVIVLNDTSEDLEALLDQASAALTRSLSNNKVETTKTINNNTLRVKTGNTGTVAMATATATATATIVTKKTPMQLKQQIIANGNVLRQSTVVAPQIAATATATTTTANTTVATTSMPTLFKQSSTNVQNLKIVSVSSLNTSLMSTPTPTITTTTTGTKVTPKSVATIATEQQPLQKARRKGASGAFAEIIISDEES